MGRGSTSGEQPDAVVHSLDAGGWGYTCRVCLHPSKGYIRTSRDAYWLAKQHLEHSHGMLRIYVVTHTEGFREMVNVALPIVVSHDLQTLDRVRER